MATAVPPGRAVGQDRSGTDEPECRPLMVSTPPNAEFDTVTPLTGSPVKGPFTLRKEPSGDNSVPGRTLLSGSGTSTRRYPDHKSQLASGRVSCAGEGSSRNDIKWAPLHVPVARRLQTLAVLLYSVTLGLLSSSFFVCSSIPLLWPLVIVYAVYMLVSKAHISGKLQYRSEWLRRSFYWKFFANYFPATLHRSSEPLDPNGRYIFGYHPHGIISHGAFAAFATDALNFSGLFPGITNTLLTLDSNFQVPFYRDFLLRMGVASVSLESCLNLLSRGGHDGKGSGRAITIVIGGAQESLHARPGNVKLELLSRKGFVKIALQTGASLVPVVGYGENDLYEQVDTKAHPWLYWFQVQIKKIFGFTIPLFHARGVFNYDVGLLPYRRPINIVVGEPIKPPEEFKGMSYSQISAHPDAVDELHERYCRALVSLWYRYSDDFPHSGKDIFFATERFRGGKLSKSLLDLPLLPVLKVTSDEDAQGGPEEATEERNVAEADKDDLKEDPLVSGSVTTSERGGEKDSKHDSVTSLDGSEGQAPE